MKNIFKSYMKAFINAWVETIGSVTFLMIFTMLIFGMLATPLQLTLKAKSIKAETNMWSQQSEMTGRLNDDFVDKYILNEDGATSLSFTYENMNYSLAIPETGWIKAETLTEIKTYANETITERESTIPEGITKEELIHQETVTALKNLTSYYKNFGDEVTIRAFSTETTPDRILTVGDIYSDEGKTLLSGLENNAYKFGYNNRSFQHYLNYTLLDQLKAQSEGTFDYEVFVNASFKVSKNADANYNYALSNAIALNGPTERNVNNLVLQSGNLPTANSEVVISDAYSRKQNKSIGDTITIGIDQAFQGSTQVTAVPFTIVGIGLKYSGLVPVNFSTFTDSIDDYARVYVKDTFFSDLSGTYTWNSIFQTDYYRSGSSTTGSQFGYWLESFISNNSNNYNLNGLLSGANITPSSSAETNALISIWNPGTTLYKAPKSQSSIEQLQNLQIITWIYVVIGSILFILGFMFIVFVLKKEINNTRKQIGVFKSLGYKTHELTWVFSVKTFITMFFGITAGYLLSFPFQINAATEQFNTFVIFDYQIIYANPIFLMILMLIVPLIFAGFSYFIIFKFLSEGALDLLTFGPRKSKSDTIVLVVKILFFPALVYSFVNWAILKILRKWNYGFTFRMQHAFVSVGKGKYAIIMGLFVFSSFLFTLQLRAMPVIQNMLEGVYNIYTKEANHVYDLSSAITVNAKNNKIAEDIREENYGIQFTNIESQTVEDYITTSTNDELYLTTKNFTSLMTTLSARRDKSIASSNWNQTSSLIAMLQALNTPLDSSYTPPTAMPPLAVQEYSILGVTPIQMGGIYLNDIGKLACISPLTLGYESASIPAYTGSCGDVETFKQYLVDSVLSMTGGIGTGVTYADKSSFSLNSEFISLVSTFAKTAEDVNPLISVNNIIFDGSREAFESEIEYYIDGNGQVSNEDSLVKMIDTTNEFGGNIRNVVNFSSVSDAQLAATREVNDEYLNGIISFRLAKILDASEGDTFDIILGRDTNVKIRVAGINANATISQDIYVDYKTTILKINGGTEIDKENLLFNTLISSKIASEGSIDLADIAASMNSFVYKRDTYTMASSKNLPWLSGIMIPIDLTGTDYENIITGITLPTSSDFVMSSAVVTIPIMKTLIDQILGKMTSSMLMYIIIDVILLIILLVVIMNIIISDSINIITVMRSLGYSNKKINWMVMGQYVIGAAASYIFAFVTSLLAWQLVQYIVWEKFAFLIALPSLPWIPFVSAIILGSILYIGWYAAMLQIKKRPLTLLVS